MDGLSPWRRPGYTLRVFRSAFGLRKGLRLLLVYESRRLSRWFSIAGNERRTAGHEALWAGLAATGIGVGSFMRFGATGANVHHAGWVLLAVGAWIALAFFFPLWLPPVRQDPELIRERRRKDEQRLREVLAVLDRDRDAD